MTEAWSSSADDSHSPFGLPRTSSELSDSELCARIRHHRPDSSAGRSAFGELYARHRLPALHLALRLNRDRSRAVDAVAEAFAKIWRAWGQNAGPEESFKPYLMAAVRSESYRRTATNRATTVVEPEVLTFLADSEPSDHAAEVAERDQLGRAFRGLPDTWQSALTLIDIDGTPTADAAESMDLSPNSFSSLLRRAREGLRAAYLQEHVEPSPPECAEYSAELARFVRQQLSPKRAEAIEAHLSHCSHCRRQSFRLRSLNTTFRAWITPAALAAALIEIGHFPEGALLLSEGSTIGVASAPHSSSAAPEPHSSALAGGFEEQRRHSGCGKLRRQHGRHRSGGLGGQGRSRKHRRDRGDRGDRGRYCHTRESSERLCPADRRCGGDLLGACRLDTADTSADVFTGSDSVGRRQWEERGCRGTPGEGGPRTLQSARRGSNAGPT
ncbi:sigma-70 family RNA polymerase sigma factor [Brevibacterium renqingii]|uniref:sigma-70 family RNA polymerase sigma factor n=1 Tax=Brevibacterium renqingii TaxID=2776916 RepID=UPI001ADFBF6E|nr:sigma-70 family RNA polymerase sigma factor [Brevibacterium renqingii]